ncbi:MAG TPA: tail fiber domain-containing protein, partial [Saprospiraceae bacterium]|nr:tail fiber domain-containing protein [Saprospiraceae bacterium]
NLNNVDWANHQYFLEVELKTNASSDYVSMATTQLLSVPYAMYAAKSGSTLTGGTGIQVQNGVINNTGDVSNTNELQTLSLSGNQLSISDGNSVTMPTGTTYSEGAGIDINGNTISANDVSPTNEIQTLSLNGNQLSLSNGGGSVQLPAGGNSAWTSNGTMTYSNPTTNDVAIGADYNNSSKLNVISSGSENGGNFVSPGSGDAVRTYCNGTGAGIRAGSLNGPGAVFTSTAGTAGYFSSTSGKGLIVDQGNVGIGINDPQQKLEVGGNVRIDGPQSGNTYALKIYSHNANHGIDVECTGTGNPAYFGAASGKALSIGNTGNGGMNTGLQIGTSLTDWDVYIDGQYDLDLANSGILRAWIFDTDGSYHNFSDSRLKKDIRPFNHVLTGLTKLQAYTYHMKDAKENDPLSVGFLAEEVEKEFPELVVEKDGYKALCYDQFAVLSVQAVKEQQTQIDTLQKKVNDLEGQLAEMKEMLKMVLEKSK